MIYIESKQTDPAYNLALETWLFEACTGDDVLYLWCNRPCVVIGRNQVSAREVDLPLARQLEVPVLRRQTGGGAVYQDMGNLNFTYITADPETERPYDGFLQPLMAVLRGQGIDAEFNGRNDLCVAGRKISGSAARVRGDRLLHHGTLLVDCDLTRMDRLLTPEREKLQRNGVASVYSRVANLQEFAPDLTVSALRELLRAAFGGGQELVLTPEAEARIAALRTQYFDNEAWNYHK